MIFLSEKNEQKKSENQRILQLSPSEQISEGGAGGEGEGGGVWAGSPT